MKIVTCLDGVCKHDQKLGRYPPSAFSYHAEHPDCPLVSASIATACPGVTLTLFSATSSGVREAHGTREECEDDVFTFAGVFSSTCKLGGEAASIGRGLQSFARITVANNEVFW